jgi:hypothetical protein
MLEDRAGVAAVTAYLRVGCSQASLEKACRKAGWVQPASRKTALL